MRTGAEYREALHDGRRVWVLGEGLIEDVTVHPATRASLMNMPPGTTATPIPRGRTSS